MKSAIEPSSLVGVSDRADFVSEKLALARGVLVLLKETRLFDPMVDRALLDLDEVIHALGHEPIYGEPRFTADV